MNKWENPIESPLVDYPGRVRFPWPFTLGLYTRWLEMNKARASNENRARIWARLIEDNGEETAVVYNSDDWGYVLAIVDLTELENLPAAALTDASGESTPYDVATWLNVLAVEYINDVLDPKKRWRRPGELPPEAEIASPGP